MNQRIETVAMMRNNALKNCGKPSNWYLSVTSAWLHFLLKESKTYKITVPATLLPCRVQKWKKNATWTFVIEFVLRKNLHLWLENGECANSRWNITRRDETICEFTRTEVAKCNPWHGWCNMQGNVWAMKTFANLFLSFVSSRFVNLSFWYIGEVFTPLSLTNSRVCNKSRNAFFMKWEFSLHMCMWCKRAHCCLLA